MVVGSHRNIRFIPGEESSSHARNRRTISNNVWCGCCLPLKGNLFDGLQGNLLQPKLNWAG
ncbi:hypothetical protein CRG98_032356 [Punica granatum]|uniref:Uncharacterized protein n=1 Tax=Punica granatum TaxID=22663 RepID=A0A2I0IT86_PUNGR|nr:hypothetical protein CRG98_032356 [Punica granatum]